MNGRIDYLGLVAFVSIADHGSFQRAAQALSLSQAALSHRLRKVEEDLGAPLLIRSSREVSLTPVGQGLLPDARRLLKELHDTYDMFRVRGRGARSRVSFACLPSIANSVLPTILAEFGSANPDIEIELLDIPVARIAENVRSGTVEFGLTIVSAELSDLRVRNLAKEDYVLVVPRHHLLAQRDSVIPKDLVGETMARISTHSKNRQLVDMALGEYRDQIDWHYVAQNASMTLRLVELGAALTILPRVAVRITPMEVVSVPFKSFRLNRMLGVVTRRNVPLSDGAGMLLGMIEERLLSMKDTHGRLILEGRQGPAD